MTQPVLRIAVQKSGRLYDSSVQLLSECGIRFSTYRGTNKLKAEASNFPVEILFVRDDDIPGYVADGVADVGIVGENVVAEAERDLPIVEFLGFSKCRLAVAVSRSSDWTRVTDLKGASIATSYPRILGKYLEDLGVSCKIHVISGSVEIAPSIGLADAICDIVDSGSTLVSNGLRELEVIFHSEAVLIAHPTVAGGEGEKGRILSKLRFRIGSVLKARTRKYIVLNAPNEAIPSIANILPGMRSPTVVPLAISGWSSIHSVMDENEFWEKIEELRAAGAEGILVVPIEKMIG
jgi:ATP phosphoribosyltransferase